MLDRVTNVRDSLLLIRNDSIVITNEKPAEVKLNSFKGKVTEIIPSEYGVEVTVDAGDLFYADAQVSEIGKLCLTEGKEVWVSFPSNSIVLIGGN
jgi:molybdopterin-binding protein